MVTRREIFVDDFENVPHGVLRVDHIRLAGCSAQTQLLSASERSRYDRLRQHGDRDRFAVGASALRTAAGSLLGVVPSQIPIDRTCESCAKDHGRPRFGIPGVWGSVAHSGNHVVVAVSTGGPVGIDIEDSDRRALAMEVDLGRHVFASPAERRTADWLETWVRKEALLKLCGVGLRLPMRELLLDPADSSVRMLIDPPPVLSGAIVRDLHLDDAVAAVATFSPTKPRLVACHPASTRTEGQLINSAGGSSLHLGAMFPRIAGPGTRKAAR